MAAIARTWRAESARWGAIRWSLSARDACVVLELAQETPLEFLRRIAKDFERGRK